jgi:hypothetical protein
MLLTRSLSIIFSTLAMMTSTIAATPFVPPAKQASKKPNSALYVRGGAGPLDATIVAKSAAGVAGVFGGLIALSPKQESKMYNILDKGKMTPRLAYLAVRRGTAMYTCALIWWFHVQSEMAVNRAMGLSLIPWILASVHALLNEKPKELGYPAGVELLNIAMCSFVAHGALAEAPHATDALTMLAALFLADGLLQAIRPALFGRTYGILSAETEDHNMVNFARRNNGYCQCAYGVFVGALALGVDFKKAIGYSWIFPLVGLMSMLFITKDIEKNNVMKEPFYLWLLIQAIVVGSLAF